MNTNVQRLQKRAYAQALSDTVIATANSQHSSSECYAWRCESQQLWTGVSHIGKDGPAVYFLGCTGLTQALPTKLPCTCLQAGREAVNMVSTGVW